MEKRNEYIKQLAAKLHEWDEKIDEMKTRAEMSAGGARLRYRQGLVELKALREQAAVLLEEVREATVDTWDDVKARTDRLIEDVRKSLRKAA